MAVRLRGPLVVLDGSDCAELNRHLGQLLDALGRRDGQVPRRLVEIREEVRRAAIQFRTEQLQARTSEAGSGTARDTRSSVTRPSGVSERLSAAEAAQLVGVSPEMIRRLACKGDLRGTRSGHRGAWVLDADSVATWQASRTERANKAA
ncbi:helix-turn-helix domain-containing protein [Streptacidiphilus anmyonensis]|uniref:helix-turn-helix domain-containing protein n=1 Tax=Streptacidiphilus anmyonensis TaxID=405782 RepID=UPI0009FE2FBB|nr:helix-turn-helix domain-containing protein [Streptacidiphilus anmyonensis]